MAAASLARLVRPLAPLTHRTNPGLWSRFLRTSKQVVPGKDITVPTVVLDPLSSISTREKSFVENLHVPLKKGFNFAAYINQSRTLQELVKLGVSLFDIENTNYQAAKHIIKLDFHKDCVPYLRFLMLNGLKKDNLGRFISEYPDIFNVPLEDLQVRLNYLEHRGFTRKMLAKALNRSSRIISHKTKTMEYKLGSFQIEFELPDEVLRNIITSHPDIIAIPEGQYKLVKFVLFEEFGFKVCEIHQIIEIQPKILDILRPALLRRLDMIHNELGFSHEVIVKFPQLITGPEIDISYRGHYLKKLKRNQYDPTMPLYVPPSSLYNLSDESFCEKYAKTSLEDYKLFCKTR